MRERYAFIRCEERHFPTVKMCHWLSVSTSGYYEWRDRPASATATWREEIAALVEFIFYEHHATYGYRRITAVLHREGHAVDGETVRSIMRERGLVTCQEERRRPRTTVQAADAAGLPDRVQRDFTAPEPGMKLVGDITYIPTWSGWVYLATVLDCFSKMVVGYAMADHMRTELVTDALKMAARNGHIRKGVTIFHSDRGSQYTSEEFAKYCERVGVTRSMGRTGICYDNAWAESFNSTLKIERVYRVVYPTRQRAIDDIAEWIELDYNRTRIHSGIGYRTPVEAHEAWFDHAAA